MAIENIGSLYPTKIPGMSDNADIQAALKIYHYGSLTVPSTEDQVQTSSIAGYIKALQARAAALESQGIGSSYQADAPITSGTGAVPDGYIWIDSDTSSPVFNPTQVYATAKYQTSAPTVGITTGTLWVDSDSTPLKLYVYSGSAWREIGA
jgi:hypothetical protein